MGDGGHGPAAVEFIRRLHRYLLFKAEWYYGGGMPDWLTRFDHNPVARRIEATFVGTHKIEHYRLWFRDHLFAYVSDILGDPQTANRPYFSRGRIQLLLDAHTKRVGNNLNELTKIISLELIQRSLLSADYGRLQTGLPVRVSS